MSQAPLSASAGVRQRLSASAISWSFFESGRTCYSVIISSYVFIPYVASVLVGNAVKGQELVAEIGQWAGLAAACVAPFLGATIDHLGRRKPALVTLSLITVPLAAALWFAAPGGGLDILAVAWLLAIIGTLLALAEVVHNATLVASATPEERPYASGVAHSFGNGASVLLMVIALWAFVLPGTMDAGWLPSKPIFGLDPAAHEPERMMGPLVAIALLVSILPFIVYARDAAPTGHSVGVAMKLGWRDLKGMIGLLRTEKNAAKYLLARLIFGDGQMGILIFTGVFAAGVFGWGPTELLIMGLISSIFAVGGGLLAGVMDTRLGTKNSLIVSICGTAFFVIGEIGLAADRLFYFWSYDPAVNGRPWNGPLLNTWPELALMGCDFGVSVFIVWGLSSSRTFMAQLAPPERSAAFFGLYALSGRATAWLCPLLVGLATAAFASQQLGLLPIVLLLVVGMLALLTVEEPASAAARSIH